MKSERRGSLAFALAMVTVISPLLSGCSALAWFTTPVIDEALHRFLPRQFVIAQISYGTDARYESISVDNRPKNEFEDACRLRAGAREASPSAYPLALMEPSASSVPTTHIAPALLNPRGGD